MAEEVYDQMTLPLWPVTDRAAPNTVVRSSLFGLVKRGGRRAYNRELIESWPGTEIYFTGVALDQKDFDLWLEVLHQCRGNYKNTLHTTANGLLKLLGKTTGSANHEWLKAALNRLTSAVVEVKIDNRRAYFGPLLLGGARDDVKGDIRLDVNHKLAGLFAGERYTRVVMETRRSLKSDLARWLHFYINSHLASAHSPHRINVKRLQELCGSVSATKGFRQQLRTALDQLEKQHIIDRWEISATDVMLVVRPQRAIPSGKEGT